MKKFKGNKGLLDKKRFEWLEEQRVQRLRKMTRKEAIRLTEEMLACPPFGSRRHNPQDHPVSLKILLQKKRKLRV